MSKPYSIEEDFFHGAANQLCSQARNAGENSLETRKILHQSSGWLVTRIGEKVCGVVNTDDASIAFTEKIQGKLRKGDLPAWRAIKGHTDTVTVLKEKLPIGLPGE